MGLAYVNSTGASDTAGDCVLAAPTGCTDGSTMLIAFVGVGSYAAPTITPPAGWTLHGSQEQYNSGIYYMNLAVYWKVWNTGESSYTWTHTQNYWGGGIIAVNGANLSDPIDTSSQIGGTANPLVVPGITTAAVNEMLIGLAVCFNGGSRSSSGQVCANAGAFTEIIDISSYTDPMAAYLLWSGSGATGDFSSTYSGSVNAWAAYLLALSPASGSYRTVSGLPAKTLNGLPVATLNGRT